MSRKLLQNRSPRFLALGLLSATCGAFCLQVVSTLAEPVKPGIVGLWYDDTGRGAVEIAPCGSALCGRIVWLKETTNAAGQPLTDKNNPEPAMRARPICGLQVLGGLKRQGDGSWDAGWVYDPKVGKSYDAALEPAGRDRLTLTGYVGVKFLGRNLSWTRAPDTLPRCAS